ncbi:MAG: ABC transporter permease, partial [Solimonas sp.]
MDGSLSRAIAPPQTASASAAPRERRPWLSNRTASILLLAFLLFLWEYGTQFFEVPRFIIPPLSDVLKALWRGLYAGPLAKDGYWYHSFITLTEVLLGFFIGSAIGLILGMLISQSERLNALIQPYITAFQSIPKVAIAPIIIMWLGFGLSSKVAIVCLLTFFPVLVTSLAGLRAVDQDRIDLLRSLSATKWQIFQKARFPSALPY